MENSEQQKTEEKPKHEKVRKPKGPGIGSRIKGKIASYKRVIDIARKPEKDEFISSAKITGAGIILLGSIGFLIFLLYFLVRAL
ncbi:MAG: protein translocase SEC61 complex subunit gamma [Candidatus Aenigmatarchaeota archaeon]